MKGGTPIPAGADLKSDTYKVPGNYYCDNNNTASTLINCPLSRAFVLKVELGTGTEYPKQTFIRYGSGENVIRTFNNSTNSWMDEYSYVRNFDLSVSYVDLINKLDMDFFDADPGNLYASIYKYGRIIMLSISGYTKNLSGMDYIIPAGGIPGEYRPYVNMTFESHGRSNPQWIDASNYPIAVRPLTDGSVMLSTGTNKNDIRYINIGCTYFSRN